jgi:hypothetical protein
MFMGAMMLIVLPLFLIVSARMTAQSEFGKTAGGKILEAFLYMSAGFCIFGLIVLIKQIINN